MLILYRAKMRGIFGSRAKSFATDDVAQFSEFMAHFIDCQFFLWGLAEQ